MDFRSALVSATTVAVACASILACDSDDNDRRTPSADAGTADGGGEAGTPSSGGSSGTGASAGAGGVSGVSGGGAGGSAGVGGVGGAGGVAGTGGSGGIGGVAGTGGSGGAVEVDIPVDINGDCVTVTCPAQTPYPVGCQITMEGNDPRGCVANAVGDSDVYFQEGGLCAAGRITGTLTCSSQLPTTGLDEINCPINKSTKIYPAAPSGCP